MSHSQLSHPVDNTHQLRSASLNRPQPVYKKEHSGASGVGVAYGAQPDLNKVIDARFKTYTWDKGFSYSQIDTSRFRSVFLADNSDFQTCLTLIEQYNKEIKAYKEDPLPEAEKGEFKNGPWKMRFFSTLANELKEVMATKDRVAQRMFAKEVNEWAVAQAEALAADSKEIKIFDNDPTFLSSSFKAPLRDFTKFKVIGQYSSQKNRGLDRSTEKQRKNNVSFSFISQDQDRTMRDPAAKTGEISHAERQYLDESTKDITMLENSNNSVLLPEIRSSSNLDNSGILVLQKTSRARMIQPSEIAAEELADYESLARTKHQEYEPPALRLREFKRRVLSFDQPSKFEFQKGAGSGGADGEEPSVFAGVIYPKPISFKEMKRRKEEEEKAARQQELEDEENDKREELGGVATAGGVEPTATIQTTGAPEGQADGGAAAGAEGGADNNNEDDDEKGDGEQGGVAEGEEKVEKPAIQPNIKNYVDDVVSKERFMRDLNARFDQRSEYVAYEPSKDEREIRMEQKWYEGRQKELKEKRENQEMIKMMGDWSLAKGRIEKEINRKIDSSIFGSQFKQCEYRYQRKTGEDLKKIDARTKDVAKIQSALQEIQEGEDKIKRIEVKKLQRIERRKERELRVVKNNKKVKQATGKGRFDDDDSDDDAARKDGGGTKSGEESFDEDLDGPFTLDNPIVKARPRLQQMVIQQTKPKTQSYDLSVSLPTVVAKQPVKGRSISNPFRALEADSRRQKIQEIANLHGKLIGINMMDSQKQEESGESIHGGSMRVVRKDSSSSSSQAEVAKGLSIYSRDVMQKLRPFSAIFDTYGSSVTQNEQLAEVVDVKNRMAKYKIALPYKKLRDAMLIPEGFTDEADLSELPEPGQGLIQNPFMKEKKKKKKKKRG